MNKKRSGIKVRLILLLLIISNTLNIRGVSADYECIFQDASGQISIKVVSRKTAKSCENCNCKVI